MRPIDADALIEFCAERWIPLNIDAVNMQPTIQHVATDTNVGDTISRQDAIDALAEQMPTPYTPDGSHPADEQIFQVQEVYADCITTIKLLPTIQPQSTTGQLNDGARSTTQSTDLIDRGQAIEKFTMTAPQMSVIRIYEAVEILESMPTIQPEPKEGHWIEGGTYRDVIECYCSECGQLMTTAATVRMNYCPNCGAKMTISTK